MLYLETVGFGVRAEVVCIFYVLQRNYIGCFESFDYVFIYTHALIGFRNEKAKSRPSWPDVCCQISGTGSPGCSAAMQGMTAAPECSAPQPHWVSSSSWAAQGHCLGGKIRS